MPSRVRIVALVVVLAATQFGSSSAAYAESTARVMETHPPRDAVLGRNESLWVRIAYTTDEPISLWVRAYHNGVQIQNVMSNASLSYTGSGEALGWFSLIEPGQVDELRIRAGGGKPYREWEVARHAVRARWTNAASSSEPAPRWVEQLRAVEQARHAEDAQRRASENNLWPFEVLVFGGAALGIIGVLRLARRYTAADA